MIIISQSHAQIIIQNEMILFGQKHIQAINLKSPVIGIQRRAMISVQAITWKWQTKIQFRPKHEYSSNEMKNPYMIFFRDLKPQKTLLHCYFWCVR